MGCGAFPWRLRGRWGPVPTLCETWGGAGGLLGPSRPCLCFEGGSWAWGFGAGLRCRPRALRRMSVGSRWAPLDLWGLWRGRGAALLWAFGEVHLGPPLSALRADHLWGWGCLPLPCVCLERGPLGPSLPPVCAWPGAETVVP